MRAFLLMAGSVLLSTAVLLSGPASAAPGGLSSIIVVGGAPIKPVNPGGIRMLNPQPLPPKWIKPLVR